MIPEERAAATVCTSGEHCPVCAAVQAWVGLGRTAHASPFAQLASRLDEPGVPAPPVRTLPVEEIASGAAVEVRELRRRLHGAA